MLLSDFLGDVTDVHVTMNRCRLEHMNNKFVPSTAKNSESSRCCISLNLNNMLQIKNMSHMQSSLWKTQVCINRDYLPHGHCLGFRYNTNGRSVQNTLISSEHNCILVKQLAERRRKNSL